MWYVISLLNMQKDAENGSNFFESGRTVILTGVDTF
jgi:hypothetical protein